MTTDTKPTNPKDAMGSAKVPTGLAPDTAITEMALAFMEGALKYGRYNWRVCGVRASIYNDAMDRHRKKWWNGQNRDPITRVRELGYVMACAAILIDSEICGMLDDDRPPMAPLGELLDMNMELVAHLKDLFKDHSPHQYTIEDTVDRDKVELFPDAYTLLAEHLEPDPLQPTERIVGMVPELGADFGKQLSPTPEETALAAPFKQFTPGRLELACGCKGYCKGHPLEYVSMESPVVPDYERTAFQTGAGRTCEPVVPTGTEYRNPRNIPMEPPPGTVAPEHQPPLIVCSRCYRPLVGCICQTTVADPDTVGELVPVE